MKKLLLQLIPLLHNAQGKLLFLEKYGKFGSTFLCYIFGMSERLVVKQVKIHTGDHTGLNSLINLRLCSLFTVIIRII